MSVSMHQSFVILAALGTCAFAQESDHIFAGANVHYFNMEIGPGDKVIKGAPYTADAVTETVQTLANGNRIVHKNTAQLARDSEGRTRREQTLDAVGPWSTSGEAPKFIMLHDPVAGVMYHLDPKNNTAVKIPAAKSAMPPPMGPGPQFFFANPGDGPAGGGCEVSPSNPVCPPAAAVAKIKAEGVATAGIAAGGMMATHATVLKMREPGEAKSESLGQQTIEGMRVTGTRTTRTIAAGAIGNDQPIEIVSETWYSPELQTVVMSRHNDPQVGETTYKLTNVQQTEPAHSLFEVPANYTIHEEKQMVIERGTIGTTLK